MLWTTSRRLPWIPHLTLMMELFQLESLPYSREPGRKEVRRQETASWHGNWSSCVLVGASHPTLLSPTWACTSLTVIMGGFSVKCWLVVVIQQSKCCLALQFPWLNFYELFCMHLNPQRWFCQYKSTLIHLNFINLAVLLLQWTKINLIQSRDCKSVKHIINKGFTILLWTIRLIVVQKSIAVPISRVLCSASLLAQQDIVNKHINWLSLEIHHHPSVTLKRAFYNGAIQESRGRAANLALERVVMRWVSVSVFRFHFWAMGAITVTCNTSVGNQIQNPDQNSTKTTTENTAANNIISFCISQLIPNRLWRNAILVDKEAGVESSIMCYEAW